MKSNPNPFAHLLGAQRPYKVEPWELPSVAPFAHLLTGASPSDSDLTPAAAQIIAMAAKYRRVTPEATS